MSFQVDYKTNVSLENLFYFVFIIYLFSTASSWRYRIKPGPRNMKNNLPSFCHWSLNSLPAHNFSKMLLLKAYNAIYKYDFICLSETYLDSSIPSDHVSLELEGYKLVRADHPNNVKRGGVCIYYKESLPVKVINLPYLQEALLLKNNYIKSLSLSQSKQQRIRKIFNKLWRSPIWHQRP